MGKDPMVGAVMAPSQAPVGSLQKLAIPDRVSWGNWLHTVSLLLGRRMRALQVYTVQPQMAGPTRWIKAFDLTCNDEFNSEPFIPSKQTAKLVVFRSEAGGAEGPQLSLDLYNVY